MEYLCGYTQQLHDSTDRDEKCNQAKKKDKCYNAYCVMNSPTIHCDAQSAITFTMNDVYIYFFNFLLNDKYYLTKNKSSYTKLL